MPKYNLMQNQKPSYFDGYFEEEEDQKQNIKTRGQDPSIGIDTKSDVNLYTPADLEDISGDSLFPQDVTENVFDQPASPYSDESSVVEDESVIEGMDDPYISQPQTEEVITREPVSFKQKDSFQAFEDEKQEGINFKPFIIGFVIIVALAGAYFGITKYVLVDKKIETNITTNVPTTIEPVKSALDIKKENILNTVNSSNKSRVGYINSLIDIGPKDVKYSSILLYDMNLSLEVFGRNRDDLAKFNVLLRNNNKIKEYNIASTDVRPGSKGGVFALFDIKLDTKSILDNKEKEQINAQSSASWMTNVEQAFKLNIKSQRQILTRQEDPFKITRNEFIFQGSEENCHKLIKQIATGNSNFKIHKIALIPMDQRDMQNSSYQLKLIMDFYN